MKKRTLLKSSLVGLCFCLFAFNPLVLFAQDVNDSEPDRIVVTSDIGSTTDEAWEVLIDFKNYEKWNQWYRLEGEAKEHSVVRAYTESEEHLDLKITRIEENTLCWRDVSWFTKFGLGGWRCRSVLANPDGSGIKFINHFEYSGPLRFILNHLTRDVVIKGMTLENQNLKDYLERR